MSDYKITQVSSQPPREWGEGAKHTYYIRTMLEGHPRPVEIGKKKLGTLSPGMTVTGTIIPKPDFEADGWKADTFGGGFGGQQASFGGGASAPKKEWQPRDDDAIRAQWAIGQALQAIVNRPEIDKSKSIDYDKVQEVANRLFAMVEDVKKGSSESTDPKAQANPTTSQSTNPARLKQGGPTWPSEHSDAEAASLYQSIASSDPADEGEPFDMSQVPF